MTNISALEKHILSFWKKDNTFLNSMNKKEKEDFVFYDGPPFANGLPHYGHILTGYIKDLYGRYQTMKGKNVNRRFGWDCHGLPAEMATEKELGIFGIQDIKKYGIDKFNNHCKDSVMKYANAWQEYVTRQARWVDFDNNYKTMDISFMESVIWAFKELYKKGLVYEAQKVMPFSWKCETPLSNFETRMDDSYRERTDKTVTALFQALSHNFQNIKKLYICAWTTTPWTLPSNLALAVNADLEYDLYADKDNNGYILGSFAYKEYKKELKDFKKVKSLKGKDLLGIRYIPLFDYFKNNLNSFIILSADFVTNESGTGIVHIAPAFGEEDQKLCDHNNITLVCPVDSQGKFTHEVPDLQGINIFDSNESIILKLKQEKKSFKVSQYIHNYPHCWRTGTPLIYKSVSSWWIKVTEIKDKMVELNQEINWIPNNVKNGLFGKWLTNAKDWAISRNRFWGTPIPIWISTDKRYPRIDVYGSIKELEKDFEVKVHNLHRPFIDSLTRVNPNDPTGKSKMKRIEDVFDCWFESGSMPYAQVHYPFNNREYFENNFPADFITEYTAQTRGWFYTLMILSTALFNKPPFLNCICHGVILDEKGQKLSKSKQNYEDPLVVFQKYGSESLRFLMLSSPIVKGSEFYIDKEGKAVSNAHRLFIQPILNSFNFYSLYAKIDNIQFKLIYSSKFNIDNYIISKTVEAVNKIDQALSEFDSIIACDVIKKYFEVLNNWYIRRNRSRFWQSENNEKKLYAFYTLASCLHQISIAMAPIIPIISEVIYQGLKNLNILKDGKCETKSVHMEYITNMKSFIYDKELIQDMDNVLEICHTALSIRNDNQIRIRQPILDITIAQKIEPKYLDLIKEEVNVKNIIWKKDVENYSNKIIKLNYAIIGNKFKEKAKEIFDNFKANNFVLKEDKLNIANITLEESIDFNMHIETKLDNSLLINNKSGIVILNTHLTDELIQEGEARDFIRFIQQLRKDQEFKVTDRISIFISQETKYISLFKEIICESCLIKDIIIKKDVSKFAFKDIFIHIQKHD